MQAAKVQRYTLTQRIFHWVNMLSVAVLFISGLGIYAPRLFGSLGITTYIWFNWHMGFVSIFLVAATFHIIYDNFVLDRSAYMWYGQKEHQKMVTIIRNFFGLTKEYPKYGKYHPAQVLLHWGIAGCLLVLAISGFILWKPLRFLVPLQLFGLGWDFIYFNRLIHDFFTAALVSLVIGHVYFGLLIKKNWTESASILTGDIPLEHYEKYHESPPDEEIAVGGEEEALKPAGA